MATGLYTAIVGMLDKRVKTSTTDPSIASSPMYPRCFQVLLGGCKGEATDSDRFLAPSYHVCSMLHQSARSSSFRIATDTLFEVTF